MIDRPPPIDEEEQPLVPEESPEEAPPAAPPAAPPPAPVEEPPPPPSAVPSPEQLAEQARATAARLDQVKRELASRHAQNEQEERTARSQIEVVRQQVTAGLLTPEQAAAMEAHYQQGYQQRAQKDAQIREAAQQLQGIEAEIGVQFKDLHNRAVLEPFAMKLALDGLAEEAAEKSGDPENFPKDRLIRRLKRATPDTWRLLQQDAIEDYREQRLTRRAAEGTDEMGGTGTGAAPPLDASATDDIAAGLRQMYGRR